MIFVDVGQNEKKINEFNSVWFLIFFTSRISEYFYTTRKLELTLTWLSFWSSDIKIILYAWKFFISFPSPVT